MKRIAVLAVLMLGAAALYAALSFLNYTRWAVNASLPPVSKNLNTSLYPLASAWFQYSGEYNITYYYIKFMPGWPELYTAGVFQARDPGWQARLEALSRVVDPEGTYAIALGSAVQITPNQDAGPYVPTTAPLVWQNTAMQRYSVLARAWFNQGGITALQLVNFTAEPMKKLRDWTFSCPTSSIIDTFYYCKSYQLNYGWDDATNSTLFTPRPYQVVTYGPEAWVEISNTVGNPKPSLRLLVDGANSDTYGVAALVIDYTAAPLFTESQISIQHLYGITPGDTRNNIGYLEFLVRRPDNTYVRLYLVRDDGSGTTQVFDVVGGTAQSVCSYTVGSGCTPPAGHIVVRLGTLSTSWATFFSGSIAQYVGPGQIEKIALVAVDRYFSIGKWYADFYVYWDNLSINGWTCALPTNVDVKASGGEYTAVYLSPTVSPTSPPSLASEVDASAAGVGYAVARYWLSSPVPAAGTSLSVWGRYVRNSTDVQNNAAFVAVGVDLDGDRVVDREYIYYRDDVAAGQSYAIVSSFVNPGSVICAASAGAVCQNSTQYFFKRLGSMTSGSNYQWFVPLGDLPGAVVAVALGAVDYSGSASGTADDFWVYWDDLSIQYSACSPPDGWRQSGGYVWQSYNYLLVTGGAAYIDAVQNALTYVANFTGTGQYLALTSSLSPSFGVYWRGSASGCVYGLNPPPAAARWVELRPLSGLGDVIVRDAYGAVLARYGCQNPPAPTYIGFKTAPGELLKVYLLEAWG